MIARLRSYAGLMVVPALSILAEPIRVVVPNKRRHGATYTASYAGTARHLVVDMAPGSYNVFQNGNLIGTALASSQGVLSFAAGGGGTFQIAPSGLPSSTELQRAHR